MTPGGVDHLGLLKTLGHHCAQVSAVSAKTNTTAHHRLGAFTLGESQVVLYDTPGVVGEE